MLTLNMPPSFLLQAHRCVGLHWNRRKMGLSEWHRKERSLGRQCCFEQDAPLGDLRPTGRCWSMEPCDMPCCHIHSWCLRAGREPHCTENPRITLPPKPTHLPGSWEEGDDEEISSPSLIYLSLSLLTKLCEPLVLESLQAAGGCSPFCQGRPSAPSVTWHSPPSVEAGTWHHGLRAACVC